MITSFRLIVALAVFLAPLLLSAQTARLSISLPDSSHRISRHIYGHFAEHLGRCIYGGFYVGEGNDTIPNTDGVRNDIIDALQELQIPNLRWPGGCFADTYQWKDGIGPKDERPEIVNRWWGGVTEDNSFGTHDFLNLCERLGAEPYLAANVGSGTVADLTDWVQYVNYQVKSPMSDLRIENGRAEPWNVKYWGVGNEMWGCGGNMIPEYYANLYRQYATFMTDWTNSDRLYRIASGANVADYHWTEVMMRDIPHNLLEGVALHSYSFVEWNDKGSASDFDEAQYFSTMQTALRMEELVEKHSAIMDKYDPARRVGLIVDEWGGWYQVEPGTNPGFLYQQNTMRDAMIAATTLNIFNNHSERVRMANLAQTVNVLQAVILTNGKDMILTPTYWIMHLYKAHQDADYLPIELDNLTYGFADEELPAISASASRDSTGTVHVTLANIALSETHTVSLAIDGVDLSRATGTILTSDRVQDHNTFDHPERIVPAAFTGMEDGDGGLQLTIPPFSAVVIEIPGS
ncbi:alpha-N-arabinofuranosidase [Neolewinella xylanilytica]|uniref:non-reducing end alpha-L-arabinofuranosidase n=1 Tax=Neolewinella xylanilytica TaxID=1514080 RepID=A0A2S6I4S2_9BACT|nr:alpha-L-arabinofuranosidase C-terminal domain-containing protein [Neolewinella xylanilytica]PPK86152.1 alpha-N-arabinofuranosidase [Neolewinella xylanilytica]